MRKLLRAMGWSAAILAMAISIVAGFIFLGSLLREYEHGALIAGAILGYIVLTIVCYNNLIEDKTEEKK